MLFCVNALIITFDNLLKQDFSSSHFYITLLKPCKFFASLNDSKQRQGRKKKMFCKILLYF